MTGPRPEDFPEFGDYSGFTSGLERRGESANYSSQADQEAREVLRQNREHYIVELCDRIHELDAEVVRLKQDRQDAMDAVRDWVKWYIRHHVVYDRTASELEAEAEERVRKGAQ